MNEEDNIEVIERPEYVAERFWDKETNTANYENMGNAYNELNSKFGGFTGSPKDGYSAIEGFEEGDELLTGFTEYANSINMNQEAFTKGWDLLSAQSGVSDEVSTENELAKLGDKPQERIDKVDNYLKNNLSASEYESMAGLITTAQGVQLVEALIPAQAQTRLSSSETPQGNAITLQEVNEMANKKDEHGNYLRSVDPAYDAKVIAAYSKVG